MPPPLIIIPITKENRHRVSKADKGLIVNPDGTLSRTYQFEAWIRNPRMQIENHFRIAPRLPEELLKVLNHPQPTSLNLVWSHEGDWFIFYMEGGKNGEDPISQRVVRIEKYIDQHGTTRKALSYGEDENEIGIWYHLEDIKRTFPEWNPPENSIYYNNKRFLDQRKRDTGGEKTPKPLQKTKEKGSETRKEEIRTTPKKTGWSREKVRDYQVWDRAQTSSPRYDNSYRKYNEERRSPSPYRKWKGRNEKRFRSPNHEEDRYGNGRGRGIKMDRSQSTRRRPSQVYR